MVLQLLLALLILTTTSPATLAQEPKGTMPMIAGAAVPMYPPLARAARVQGVIHIRVTTDGTMVAAAHAEDGNRLLAVAAEENVRTWQFSKHQPTSFTVTYRYRLDAHGNPNNPTVIFRFPTDVEVSIAPLVISDPPARIQ